MLCCWKTIPNNESYCRMIWCCLICVPKESVDILLDVFAVFQYLDGDKILGNSDYVTEDVVLNKTNKESGSFSEEIEIELGGMP
jgi:hypothetical protein